MRYLILFSVLATLSVNSAAQNFLVLAKLEGDKVLTTLCGEIWFNTGYSASYEGGEVEVDYPSPTIGCYVDVKEQTYRLIEAVGVSEHLERIKVIHFSNAGSAASDPIGPYYCVEYEKRKEGKFVVSVQSASYAHQCKRIENRKNGT